MKYFALVRKTVTFSLLLNDNTMRQEKNHQNKFFWVCSKLGHFATKIAFFISN